MERLDATATGALRDALALQPLSEAKVAFVWALSAGQVPLALTVYSYKPEQQKREGAPVEPLYLRPVVALGYGPAVSRCAPHPHAALLFHDFMIREGQEIMAKRDMTPTNPKIRPLLDDVDLTMIDPVEMLDNRKKWDELWTNIVLKPR